MAIIIDDGTTVDTNTVSDPLTTDAVLALALGRQHDTSSTLRGKALAWLNDAMQLLYLERDWMCLERTAELTITDSTILKPLHYGRLRYISADAFFLKESNRLTEQDAAHLSGDSTDPVGFTENAINFTFYPGAEGDVTLGYVRRIPEYADGDTTILDVKFKRLLARAVMSAVYEYEEDGRTIPSIQLDQVELDRLKYEENRQKPLPRQNTRGYLRGRR